MKMNKKYKVNSEFIHELDNMWEEKSKESIKQHQMVELLKNPGLLGFIDIALEEKDVNEAVKGEIHSKLTSFMLCNSMNLGNHLMIVFKGSSSIGKTNLANMVTGLFKTKKMGDLSPTALKYSEDEEVYHILYYQETSEEESGRKSFKFISSDDGGFAAETSIKNPKTGKFELQKTEIAAIGFVTTTTAIELDKEFSTRSFTIPLDESQEQTELILGYNLSETERKMAFLDGKKRYGEKYNSLKDALDQLSPYDVAMPFESEIRGVFPKDNVPLRVRRDSKKLVTLIKSSALLFQHQRPKVIVNDNLLLVATWQDLYNAIRIALPIMNATMTGYDSRTKKAIRLLPKIILEHRVITSENLASMMGDISKNYSGRILKQLNESGAVYEDNELKNEMGITGKTKVYGINKENRIETFNDAIQHINWTNVVKKQRVFLDRYRAKCEKNRKHKNIVETYLTEYDRYAIIVYDPVDHYYKKLEQDDHQNLHFALLTSEEKEALNNSKNKDMSCKKARLGVVIKVPTSVIKVPWESGWWNNPNFGAFFDAEDLIIETIENPAHINPKGWIRKDKLLDILSASFDYGKKQCNAIIESMKIEGDLIEPEEGYLTLNMPMVKYNKDYTIIGLEA